MAKNKRSKILAMALCASVMTGIYASPVMAEDLSVNLDGQGIVANEVVGVSTEKHKVTGTLTIAGSDIATALNGTNLTLNSVTANTISTTGNTVVGGTLTATGAANLNGGLTVKGGLNVNDGPTVIDGGRLFANKGLTVSSHGISIEAGGDLSLEDGNVDVGGNLTVNGETTLKNTKVNGTLTAGATTVDSLGVTNNATVGGTLEVTGDTTLAGLTAGATTVDSLGVTNNATVGGTLEVTGDTTLAGLTAGATTVDSLKSNGNAEVGGTLAVTGNTTLAGLTAGATTVDSLKSNGNAEVGGTLAVTGDTTLAGLTAGATTVDSLTVNGAATVDSLEVAKGIEAANGKFELTKEGVLTVNGEAAFTKGVTVQNGLSVTGGASVSGDFAVTNGGLSVSGGESVLNGGLTVNNGDTKLNGKLDVGAGNFEVDTAGNTEFNGNLNIGHDNFTVEADTGNTVVKGSLELGTLDGREVGEVIKGLEEYTGKLQDADLPGKVEGIDRDPVDGSVPNGEGVTTIEGMAKFDSEGMTIGNTVVTDGAITTNTINAGGTIINNVGMTVGDTAVADSKITVGAADDQTIIEGGAITAKSLVLGTKDVGATIAGIERETITDEFGNEVSTTTIEGALKVSNNGLISNAAGSFTVDSNGGLAAGGGTFAADMTGIKMNAPVQMFLQGDYNYKGGSVIDLGTTISDIDDRLDVLEVKTQNIKPGTGAGTGTGEGGTAVGEDNNTIDVPATNPGHTGINGNVTVGGEINAGAGNIGGVDMEEGAITTGNTTIDGEGINTGNGDFSGEVNVGGNTNITGDGITTGNGEFTGNVTVGDGTTITGEGITTGNGNFTGDVAITGDITADNGNFTGNVDVDGKVTVGDGTTITGEGITTGTGTFDDVIIGENTTIDSNGINTNDITAVTGTIGNVEMDNTGIIVGGGTAITEDTVTTENIKADDGEFDSQVTVGGNTTITDGNINLGGVNGTNINADGMIVGNANGANTNVSAGDVVITDKDGKDIALSDVGYVENIDRELQANGNYDGTVVGGINAEADIRRAEVNRLDNRISKVEDRVDKVGAMSAAIANLRTMGYDPAAPTEIAVGVGQYRSETGVALGMFHYPNKDFMLSLSVSTSGDEVMGGIGATWKFGRKSPEKVLAAEKEKAAKAKLAKAEAMKQAAKEAKIKAQQERHAKLAAERAAQAEAAK